MELSYDLFDVILIRVPVKYLLRCRCVSKRWCSVIDSTEFVEKHFKESVERNRGGIIIQGFDFDDPSHVKYLLADLESFDDGRAPIDISKEVEGILNGARLVGSANGLVCLTILSKSNDDVDLFFLLNPCTRKCKKVPIAGTKILHCNNLHMYFQYGFGYDHVSDDYKVVMMASCKLTHGIMAIVYSLKKNSWTLNPNVFSTHNIGFTDRQGVFADGALLWNAIDLTSENSVVVGFDLGLEQFREAKYFNGIMPLMEVRMENSQAEEIIANPVFRCLGYTRFLTYSKSRKKILLEVDNGSLEVDNGSFEVVPL